MQKIIVLLALVAVVLSQQDGPLSVTYLTSGTPYSGTLENTTDAANFNVQLFALWVPENTTNINITLTNTNSDDCSTLVYYGNSESLPCAQDDYESETFLCAQGNNLGQVDDSETTIITPGFESGSFYYAGNKYMYLSVGRWYGGYNDEDCTYTLAATVSTGCAAGQVVYDYSETDDDDEVCLTYTNVVQGTQYPISNANVTLFKTTISQLTGNFIVTVNSSSSAGEMYGASYAAPSSQNYKCETDTPVTVGTFNIYTLNCFTPKAGDFFFIYEDSTPAYTASVSVQVLNCSTNGGANCTSPITAFNLSMSSNTTSVSVPNVGGSDGEGYVYFYIDVPVNSTNTVTINAESDNAEAMIIRRNAFPEDDSTYGFENSDERQIFPTATFVINNFDFAVAGRIYIGLSCDNDHVGPCTVNLTISNNSTSSSSSSSGDATTGTVGATTGTGGSSNSTVTTGVPTPTTGPIFTTGITTGTTTASTTEQASSVSVLVPSMIVADRKSVV